MSTTCYDEYNIYKNGNTDKFKRSRHPKEISKRINANQKKKQQFEKHISDRNSIYHETSNTKVDKISKSYNEYHDNIYYYPGICGCCWKNGTKWYRRHHNDLMRKGKNKDKIIRKQGPSYMSNFCQRELIKDGLKIYLS